MLEKEQAVFLSEEIEQSNLTLFDIKKLDTTIKNFLPGFQKGKEAISGYEITKLDTHNSYLFAFIHTGDHYCLVIYSKNKKAMAELKNIDTIEGNPHIVWRYNPAKRDGKNQERKDYFTKNFGPSIRQIPIPKSSAEIETFICELFRLCENRLEADSFGEGK